MKTTPRWRCGHERTEANTKLVRNRTGKACLICFRALNRDYMRRQRAARDSDGTRSAETACPAPVPQDCQARAVRHRPDTIAQPIIIPPIEEVAKP